MNDLALGNLACGLQSWRAQEAANMLIRARFSGPCKRCGGLMAAGDLVEWSKDAGATHADRAVCARQAAPVLPAELDVAPIVALLEGAKARGLTWPKVRFLGPASRPGPLAGRQELRLSLSGPTSRTPGSVVVKLADAYQGLVTPGGGVRGGLAADRELLALVALIAREPARLAAEYGAVTCACSFCSLALTDEGSIAVGYGPICAARYELPHTAKGGKTLRPLDAGLFQAVQS